MLKTGLAGLALVAALGLANAQAQEATVDRIYVMDCGHNAAADQARWSPGVNVGKPIELSDNCYAIKHGDDWLLWDTGYPDAIAEKPVVTPVGTLNNATFPAAVGRGPIGPAWLTGNLIAECLAQMLDRDVSLGKSVQATCCGTWDTAVIAGLDERGEAPAPFLSIIMEPMVGQIELFAFSFAPVGFLPCNGQPTFALPTLAPITPQGPGYYIAIFGVAPPTQ